MPEERIMPVRRKAGGRIKEHDGGYQDEIASRDEMRVSAPRASYDYTASERAHSVSRSETAERTGTKIMPKVAERRESNFGLKLAAGGVVILLVLFFLFMFTPLGDYVRPFFGAL